MSLYERMYGGGCPYSDSPSIKNILGTSKSEYQTQPADYKIDMRLNANALTISISHQATVDFNNLEIHVVITEKTHWFTTLHLEPIVKYRFLIQW